MPILAALGKALPYLSAAWQVGSQFLNKPKKEDFVPTGSMYQRYINHLKSQTAGSRAYQQRIRPALRQIGTQTRRGQRQVDYFTARTKPGGGVEAQMRLGINQQALEAIGIASEKASFAQERVNERTGEQLLRIGVAEERGLQRYQRAKQQFTRNIFATTAQVGINLANVAVQQHIADTKLKLEAAKDAKTAADAFNKNLEQGIAEGVIPKGTTPAQYQSMLDTADFENPDVYNKYLANIRKQETADIKFQKSEEAEAFKGSSFEALRQFTEQLERIEDPTQAYAAFDEVKDFMSLKDKNKALTKVESTFPDLVYETSFERKNAIADTQNDLKAAKKNINEAIESGSVKDIVAAGNTQSAITSRLITAENFRYSQDTRQTAADKKESDAKILELQLGNDLDSLIGYLGVYDKTYSVPLEEPTIGDTIAPLKKSLERIERDRVFKKLTQTLGGVTFKDGKGMTSAASKGLKRLAVRYVSLIDIDSAEEKNALRVAVGLFDEDEVRRLSQSFTGLDAKNAATFTLEIMKRIDSLFKKLPYDNYDAILDSLSQ